MYWKEVRFRFYGDPETCRKYMHEARQYLGQLADMMKHGIIPSNARKVTNAAGVVFILAFYMGQPIAEIYAQPTKGGKVTVDTIQGFVVRPSIEDSQLTQSMDNFILLDPEKGWGAYFYQAADFPTDPDFVVGQLMADHLGKPLYPNGLEMAGNVDWRDTGEANIVSWRGPRTRYYGQSELIDKYLFAHGRPLLNVDNDLTSLGFFGDTSGYIPPPASGFHGFGGGQDIGAVTGACMIGNKLFVTIRFGTLNDYFALGQFWPRHEFLISLDVITDDERGGQNPFSQNAVFRLSEEQAPTLDGNPQILWERDVELWDVNHPWFFNQSGTQARCVRYDNGGTSGGSTDITDVVECVLSKDPETDVWSYAEDTENYVTYTKVTTIADYDSTSTWATPVTDHYQEATPAGTCHPVAQTAAGFEFVAGTFSWVPLNCSREQPTPSCWLGFSTAGHTQIDQTADNDWIKVAVDFRDDAAVYAYAAPKVFSSLSSWTFTPDGSVSQPTHSVSGSWGTDFIFTDSFYEDYSSARTTTTDMTGQTGGIKTDWLEVTGALSETLRQSGDCATTHHLDGYHTHIWSPPVDGGPCGYEVVVPFTATSETYTSEGNGSIDHEEVAETVSVLYLDLRYQVAAYAVKNVTTTTAMTFSGSATGDPLVPQHDPTGTTMVTNIVTDYTTAFNVAGYTTGTTATTTETASSPAPAIFYYVLGPGGWFFFPGYTVTDTGCGITLAFVPDAGGCTPDTAAMTPSVATLTSHPSTSDITLTGLAPESTSWGNTADHVGESPLYTFTNYGSWQTYKGAWCFSQAMPDDDPTVANFVYKAADANGEQDMKHLTNTDGDATIVRFHPLWVLPKVNY